MTGESSRDLRPEIGAPVLITTTALDIDKIESLVEDRAPPLPKSVIPSSSSDSDTDVFADASASINDFGNIKFSFFDGSTPPPLQIREKVEMEGEEEGRINVSTSTEEGDYEVVPSPRGLMQLNQSLNLEQQSVTVPLRKNKSVSVCNLREKRQEEEVEEVTIGRHPVSSVDLPSLGDSSDKLDGGGGGIDDDVSGYYNEPYDGSDKENSASSCNNKKPRNWNANNSSPSPPPPTKDHQEFSDFKRSLSAILLQQTSLTTTTTTNVDPEKSSKSLNESSVSDSREKSVAFDEDVKVVASSTQENNKNRKKITRGDSDQSHSSVSCLSEDFDLKSASYEDMQERGNLFLSIEEFNALTKEINESEEFNNSITEIDREYCEHRNNLQPNQRRVTLMRNRPNKIHLNLHEKREKITTVWSGFKHWLDEERGKIKEVVQRHAAMQRVGANLKSPTRGGGEDGPDFGAAAVPRDKSLSIAESVEEEDGEGEVDDLEPRRRRSEERGLQRQKSKSSGASAVNGGAASAEVINVKEQMKPMAIVGC